MILSLAGEIMFIQFASSENVSIPSSLPDTNWDKLGSNWNKILWLELIPDVVISIVFISAPYVFYKLENDDSQKVGMKTFYKL